MQGSTIGILKNESQMKMLRTKLKQPRDECMAIYNLENKKI